MAMWFYQLSHKAWSLNNYRLDIWEGEGSPPKHSRHDGWHDPEE